MHHYQQKQTENKQIILSLVQKNFTETEGNLCIFQKTVYRAYTNIFDFNVKVGLHQGSALSPFLFAVIMDRIIDEVRREPS